MKKILMKIKESKMNSLRNLRSFKRISSRN